MKLKEFADKLANLPWFDATTAQLVSGMEIGALRVYLSRWARSNDILQIRRGLYVFAAPWKKVEPDHLAMAQAIQSRSYITAETAAQYHGLIPEGVFTQVSATLRRGGEFDTPIGHYKYHRIPQSLYGGGELVDRATGQQAFVATPAKTLIDLFYFGRGSWPMKRIAELRLQNLESVDFQEGAKWASKLPRLERAWRNLARFQKHELKESKCEISL